LIDFRYHIVSLIAVFLALALGLFVGSTTLQGTVTNNLRHQADTVTNENSVLTAKKTQLSKANHDEQAMTSAVEPYAVSNQLPGDSVVLVSAPGVDSKARETVTSTLELAGATVSADIQIQPAYLDPTQDAELDGLAASLRVANERLPTGNGSTEVSAELAAALVARPGHHTPTRTQIESTLNALSDGKFLNFSGNPPAHPAAMAVMLLATPNTDGSVAAAQAQNTILTTLASDLSGSSSALVIAGPSPIVGATNPSALSAAMADSSLTTTASTVTLDTGAESDPAAGRIAIVLALAAAPAQIGAYGLGEHPPLPTPSASP
jgi:hypothetical protein